MSSGFFALLDDIAAIAKVAAATLDDTATQAAEAGAKAAGIVIDDTAVTPRYVVGFAADRELPIIAKIAWGSLKNKLLFLLPAALALSVAAPWAITPLLMLGAVYLCYEGYEKFHELVARPSHLAAAPGTTPAATTAKGLEDVKVASAIRTDFILSAEIMAIALATITSPDFVTRAIVLALVGLLVTAGVYGFVALIVKADDFGLFLAKKAKTRVMQGFGRGLVAFMPRLLSALSIVGIAAMLWVGGGIILHGFDAFGYGLAAHAIHDFAARTGGAFGPMSGFTTWLIAAAIAGLFGIAIGWVAAALLGIVNDMRVAH